MADGYARATGTVGVVLTTSGPGATNALTGVVNANESGTSLLIVTGEPPQQFAGMGYLQEGVDLGLDINEVYKSSVSYSAILTTAADASTLIAQALRVALSAPGGAAHISLPDDVSASKIAPNAVRFPMGPSYYRARSRGSDPGAAVLAWGHVAHAHRPAILVGNGARAALRNGGLATLTSLVERYAIPVITTPEAKFAFGNGWGKLKK
jgi:acetolactate synthase-1/2/3 large subunit